MLGEQPGTHAPGVDPDPRHAKDEGGVADGLKLRPVLDHVKRGAPRDLVGVAGGMDVHDDVGARQHFVAGKAGDPAGNRAVGATWKRAIHVAVIQRRLAPAGGKRRDVQDGHDDQTPGGQRRRVEIADQPFETDGPFVLVPVRASDGDHGLTRSRRAPHAERHPHAAPGSIEREWHVVQPLPGRIPIDLRCRRGLQDHPFPPSGIREAGGVGAPGPTLRLVGYLSSHTSVKKSRCCG